MLNTGHTLGDITDRMKVLNIEKKENIYTY
jgi:hypothetical protein